MKRKDWTELASLLDGEIRDALQAESLGQRINADPQLLAEFEMQREVKALLASLPEYSSPDFMATRVVGEINARRKARRAWLKPVSVSAAALMVLIITMTTATHLLLGQSPGDSRQELATKPAIDLLFVSSDNPYKPQDWRTVSRPEGVADEQLLEFIEFANEAHHYKSLTRFSDMMSPDIAEAILVLDSGGGN